jgi:heat shock protein HslJ
MSSTRLFVASLVLAVASSACAAVPPAADPPAGPAPGLEGTAWVLAELPGHALVPGSSITLRFEDGRAGGSDGCNRFGYAYATTASKLEFKPGGMATQMACAPKLMQQASAFRASLDGARTYRVEAGRLRLLGADGALLASFTPQPEGLAGTAWQVTGYNNGRQAVVSVLAGSELTLEFSADGRVAGFAGCNRYTGSFRQDGRALSFGPAAATRRMCVEPEGVMEQEQQFLKALETVATSRQEADRLELRTADGAMAVTLHRTPTQ